VYGAHPLTEAEHRRLRQRELAHGDDREATGRHGADDAVPRGDRGVLAVVVDVGATVRAVGPKSCSTVAFIVLLE